MIHLYKKERYGITTKLNKLEVKMTKLSQLLKAIRDNTMSGQIEFNDGVQHIAVVPLQYIADEIEACKEDEK